VAEKEIEQFATPKLPIIEDTFQITHQQAAKADDAKSPRVVLRTILKHIGGPGGGYIEEVMEEMVKEEEELAQQLRAVDQLPGVGDAAGADRARDDSPMGDRPTTQETRSRIDFQAQGWAEYNPDDMSSYLVMYADGPDEMRVTRWVWMIPDNEDTWIKGTEGPRQWIYHRQLRSQPYLAPNFNWPHDFHNDHLSLFHLTHPGRQLIDRAIGHLTDLGLAADI
jgi:hypothetical protein